MNIYFNDERMQEQLGDEIKYFDQLQQEIWEEIEQHSSRFTPKMQSELSLAQKHA
jgi:hypothetical protein